MVLGPRQTGKSTAAAVRVLFEAMSHDNALILFAGASGRQSGQIMEKARQLAKSIDLAILSPPSKCEGFTLANGSQIVSLPDNEKIIRCFSAPRLIVVDEAAFASPEVFMALEPMLSVSNGTIMLLSTPNGQTEYYYEQWHAKPTNWAKIKGTLSKAVPVSNRKPSKPFENRWKRKCFNRNSSISSSPPAVSSSAARHSVNVSAITLTHSCRT